jgi:hypothetical protein
LIAIIALLSIALIAARFWPSAPAGTMAPDATNVPVTGPFVGLPLRYDGYYKNSINDLQYLIRFFPEGRVVSVNGTKDVEKDLPSYLIRETRGNPALGLHNVPVSVVGDSIVFITRPEKGEIEYRGTVVSSSMVRLVRHSHITGSKQLMDYIFYPDAEVSQ